MNLNVEINPIHIGIKLTRNPEALAGALAAIAVNAHCDLAKKVKEHVPDALRDRTADMLEKLLAEIST